MGLSKLKQLIKQCNSVLSTLDKLEENRPLYPPEFNLRKILKKHILKLLQNQKEYWRKNTGERGTHLDGLNLEMKVQKNFMLQLLNGIDLIQSQA
jgi:hypothetical protein